MREGGRQIQQIESLDVTEMELEPILKGSNFAFEYE